MASMKLTHEVPQMLDVRSLEKLEGGGSFADFHMQKVGVALRNRRF
jgi:hypothetical protein